MSPAPGSGPNLTSPLLMWRDALLVAGKDLRIELRSRVATNQVAPFAILVLVLFAFALDPSRGILAKASAGLFWVAVLFSALLTVQRSFALETTDGARDGLRLSGLDPAGIFLGKAAAIAVQLLALEVLLGAGVVVLYNASIHGVILVLATCLVATLGMAAAATIYGGLASGLAVRDTLLPLLVLPVLAPVLLAATQACQAALDGTPGDGWPWLRLLGVFAALYLTFGVFAFGPLLEES
jgi:heme exporter protein B